MIRICEEQDVYLYNTVFLLKPDVFQWLYDLARHNNCYIDDVVKCLIEQCYSEGKELK